MIIIQHIKTSWTKYSRGAPNSTLIGRQIDILSNIQLVNDQHTYAFNLLSPDPMVLLTPVVTYEHLRGFKTGNGFGLNGNGLLDLLGNANDADKNAARPYVVGTMFREDQEQQNNAAILNEVLELEKAHAINPIDGKRHSIDGVKVDSEQAKVDGKKHRCGFGFAVALPVKVRHLSINKSSEEEIVVIPAENNAQKKELIVEDVAPKENSTTKSKQKSKKSILAIREFINYLEKQLDRDFTPQEKGDIWKQLEVIKEPIPDLFGNCRYIVALKNGILDVDGKRLVMDANPQLIHKVFGDFARPRLVAFNVNGVAIDLPLNIEEPSLDMGTLRWLGSRAKKVAQGAITIGGRLGNGIAMAIWPAPLGNGELKPGQDAFNNIEVEALNYVPVFVAPLVPVKPPKVPNKMVNPALKPRDVDNRPLIQPRFEGDVVGNIEGQRLDQKPLDVGMTFTPGFDGDRVQNMYREQAPIRRYVCSNDLIYEDAPYHGIKDNPVKSKAPTNPKEMLETSKEIGSNTRRRISYDKNTGEICVFDNTRENVYHGHVAKWNMLEQRLKNVLVNDFGFKPNGKLKNKE